MKKITVALACIAMAGCATCERHRTACEVGAVVIAGAALTAVAVSESHSCSVTGATYAPPCARH